jgi:hypothetical protein
MINFKAVGISVALFALAFKLNNVMPTSLPFPIIALIIGLSLTFVYLSRIIIRVEKDELLLSAGIVAGIITLAITYLDPVMFGITNVAKLVQVPGTQGILSWMLVDVVGIPSAALWVAFIAIVILLFVRPLLAFGLALILAGVIIFLGSFWAGITVPGAIITSGAGLLMSIIGIMGGNKGARIAGARMLSQPIINVYNSDSPGPAIKRTNTFGF